jgi:hypothetical protein
VTALGLGGKEMPEGEVAVGFRRGLIRHFKVALTSAGGAALAWAALELFRTEPRASFALLEKWGPWPVLGIVGLALLGRFMGRMNDTIQTTFTSVVESVSQGVQAQGRMADAVTRLADNGSRQAEEVRRLAIYAGREFPNLYERLDKQDEKQEEKFSQVMASLRGVHARLGKHDTDKHDHES